MWSPAPDDRTLHVWNLLTGRIAETLQGHTSSVNTVAVTPDGRYAVSGSQDRTVRIWDLTGEEATKTLQGHTSSVYAVAVTPDGRYVISGSDDRTLRIWDSTNGKQLVSLTLDGDVRACIAAHIGRTIVAGDVFGRLHFLRLEGVN